MARTAAEALNRVEACADVHLGRYVAWYQLYDLQTKLHGQPVHGELEDLLGAAALSLGICDRCVDKGDIARVTAEPGLRYKQRVGCRVRDQAGCAKLLEDVEIACVNGQCGHACQLRQVAVWANIEHARRRPCTCRHTLTADSTRQTLAAKLQRRRRRKQGGERRDAVLVHSYRGLDFDIAQDSTALRFFSIWCFKMD